MPSPVDPTAFVLFGIGIRWYAIFILTGIASAIAVAYWLARYRNLDGAFLLDTAPWVVFAGIVGARLTYVLLRLDYFTAHPLEAVNIRLGGLAIHGSLIAGGAVFAWFCARRKQPFLGWADVILPGVALAQAIGRWGNWANQEAFGQPTSLPWGLAIDPAHRPPEYAAFDRFHPTFLYESLFNLLNACILIWIARNVPNRSWLREGDGVGVYGIMYGVGRFLIESIRTDSLYAGPLPGAYWASAAFIIAGVAVLIWNRRRRAARGRTNPTPATPATPL